MLICVASAVVGACRSVWPVQQLKHADLRGQCSMRVMRRAGQRGQKASYCWHGSRAERAKSLVLLAREQGREGKKPCTVGPGAGQRGQKASYCWLGGRAERAKSLVLLARGQGREGKKPCTVGTGTSWAIYEIYEIYEICEIYEIYEISLSSGVRGS